MIFEEKVKINIMKKIMFILLLIIGTKTIFADCSSSGMQFFPQQKEISLNSMFIIQGYYFSQKTINSFKNRIIYLQSEKGDEVKLKLEEILKGHMQLSQAIFSLTRELKKNTIYYLKYSDETEEESREMKQYNKEKKKFEKVYWRTTNKKLKPSIDSNLNIQFKKTNIVHFGCGPSADAIFSIKDKSKSEIWYRTEVVDIDRKVKTVYYLKGRKEELYVGHGMCSGAFTFNRNSKYKVRFLPMNTDGKSQKMTDWKIFESPFKNDKGGF